ncbi:hypothetical protein ACEN8K_36920, partial [Variovorax sp. CT11-76]
RHLGRAAQASRMSPAEFAQALQALEAEYGHALLRTSEPSVERSQRFEGFTPQGEQVLAWARGPGGARRRARAGRGEGWC